jgi:hypothetical protein
MKNDDDPAMRVCMFCGSPRPEELLPQCAHGMVAIVRGKERRLAARLHVEFRAMHAARVALFAAVHLAGAKGEADIDDAPQFEDAGDNVVPLHDRAILL